MEQIVLQDRQVESKVTNRARLLISCNDKPGIVSKVSQFLFERGANIVQSDQHTTDPEEGQFFMRIEFDVPDLQDCIHEIEADFESIADDYQMNWEFRKAWVKKKMAIFVSNEDHCLQELLWQWRADTLNADIAMVISNHLSSKETVESYGIPYYYLPVTKETKPEVEQKQLALLREHDIDVVVLARYMQILTPQFVSELKNKIINIHHSFLPAFIGANPYRRAYERGVKLIGATAHYVTNDLDEGPIIEQDVQRVYHRHTADDLKRIGRHIERIVLAQAVTWHLEDKILTYQNKTIVFQ